MSHLPSPPSPRVTGYPRRAAAWVCLLVDTTLLRACPALAAYPRAAGRVAWATTRAVVSARGLGETDAVLSMSSVISPELLEGWLPEEDIAVLRGLQLDIREVPDEDELKQRLILLREAGPRLPRYFQD
ncbi:hypothetical protein [Nocardiopsis sp. YSL2]|uniref:hypothetical protein n=1 Tax=Nocardiopsis sp. YSL2 TaxID=2939492 RepID=UPI0026F425DE|nr:hypothetical protein [Nocardiopsis sp. YSL2]